MIKEYTVKSYFIYHKIANFYPRKDSVNFESSGFRELKNAINIPSTKIFYRGNSRYVKFYIVRDSFLHGYIIFDFKEARSELKSYNVLYKSGLKFAVPHASLSKEFSGKGILFQIYLIALSSGISLLSSAHTKAASNVWDKLATKAGIRNYWVDTDGIVDKPTRNAVRVLTKSKI